MRSEAEERAAVVAAARGWLRTPFHHEARLKGVGVDCAQLLIACYAEAGLIEPFETAPYSFDWAHSRGGERYMEYVLAHAREFDGPPGPGDIALWRFGRSFSHGGIVIEWPRIIHAHVKAGCVIEDGTAAWLSEIGERGPDQGKPRPRKFFTPWPR